MPDESQWPASERGVRGRSPEGVRAAISLFLVLIKHGGLWKRAGYCRSV